MSRRLTKRPLRPLTSLRVAVLTGVAAGALLVPATAAFADATPTPVASDVSPEGKDALEKKRSEDALRAKEAELRKAEAAKAESAKSASGKEFPRGGVAAGEAPAQDDNTGALVGSATGALLLAGAGTYVLRRRTAARREG
ncbi:sortase-dependent protein [Streptomyces sp. NPDC047042]|uniref:sortase-dependent protein n=1 Tax=Streptomyces sp. NPDC047042 TaxID=3154807 RepID=UPI0033D31FBE